MVIHSCNTATCVIASLHGAAGSCRMPDNHNVTGIASCLASCVGPQALQSAVSDAWWRSGCSGGLADHGSAADRGLSSRDSAVMDTVTLGQGCRGLAVPVIAPHPQITKALRADASCVKQLRCLGTGFAMLQVGAR